MYYETDVEVFWVQTIFIIDKVPSVRASFEAYH